MQQLLVLAILFFLTVPGVLVTLPRGGSKYVVAATHAVVFAALYFLLYRYVLEGFSENLNLAALWMARGSGKR